MNHVLHEIDHLQEISPSRSLHTRGAIEDKTKVDIAICLKPIQPKVRFFTMTSVETLPRE
jgi:hypothetical protein